MMKVIANMNMTHHSNDDLRRSNIQRWRTQQLRKSQIQNSLDWRRRRFMMLMMMTRMMRKAMTWTLLVAFGDKYNGTISVKLMSENLSLLMNLVSLPMSYSYINCFRCLALMVEKGNGFCNFFDAKTLIFHSLFLKNPTLYVYLYKTLVMNIEQLACQVKTCRITPFFLTYLASCPSSATEVLLSSCPTSNSRLPENKNLVSS